VQGKHIINIIDICFHLWIVVKAGWSVRPKWERTVASPIAEIRYK